MSKLQHPEIIVLNGERYSIARNKKGARLWEETTVPVQPGGGEKQVVFDTWHLGMGHSRLDQSGVYEYTTGANATHPWKLVPGANSNALAAASGHSFHRLIEWGGSLYAFGVTDSDNDLYYARINSTPAVAAQAEMETGNSGPPGQPAVWENELYVGVTANEAFKFTAADTYAKGDACEAIHFCRVGRDMWGVPLGSKGKVSKLAAGSSWTWGTDDKAVGTSPWGSLYNVGDIGQGINSLLEWGRWGYPGKGDGFFNFDTDGYAWNQIPEVIQSSNNCLRLEKWQGMAWAPSILGFYRYTGLNARTQGPEVLNANASIIRGGYFTALAKAGHWLYGAYKAQDNQTYILTARLREPNEPGPGELIWHNIAPAISSSHTVSDMLVTTITSPPTLWLAYSSSHILQYYILNKDGSLNPADSSYANTTTEVSTYLPRIDLDSPGTPKAGHFVEVHASGTVGTTNYIEVLADWDGGGFNQVGADIAASGFTRRFFTAGTNDTGRILQLRIDQKAAATSAHPVVERVGVNLIESPRREPAIRCSVRLADMLDKKNSVTKMMTNIEALLSGSAYDLTDPDDPAAGTLKVILHDYEFVEAEQAGAQQAEKQCNLTLRVVSYS